MSEYWKSTPKYWCKHCSTYVKDTPFEKKQHESTGKHQGNLRRFLRGIQNDHEKGERDKEKAKAEVDRLNRVVGGDATGAASSAGPSTIKPSSVRKAVTGATTAGDQKRQWAQLAEMGIQVPDNFRAEMAMPGQWQSTSNDTQQSTGVEDSLSKGVRKRKLEGDDEEEEAETTEDTRRRGWGSTTRRYPGQNNSDVDLDALLSDAIVKKEPLPNTNFKPKLEAPVEKRDSTSPLDRSILEAQQPHGETNDKPTSENTDSSSNQATIKEEDVALTGEAAVPDIPQDPAPPVFKKRKAKSKAGRETD